MRPDGIDPSTPSTPADEGAEPEEICLDLRSDLRLIEDAVDFLVSRCRAYAYGGSRLQLNFRVSVTEALANAILYGNSRDPDKTVRVEASIDSERVALRVEDQGSGFDPDAVPDPTLPGNLKRPGGRGIFLIRQLMDEVEFNDRGNAVRLVLCREAPEVPEAPEASASPDS